MLENGAGLFLELFWKEACTFQITGLHEEKIAIIIGAGPAGLTAAYELLQRALY